MADEQGNGSGDYRTFAGAGFGTLMVQLATGPKETPLRVELPVKGNVAIVEGKGKVDGSVVTSNENRLRVTVR